MSDKLKGLVLIIISACAFGSIPVINRIAISAGGNETSIMIIRFAIVSLFFTAFMKIRRIKWHVTRNQLFGLLFLGLVCYGNVALMMFLAMKYISAALGSLILYIYPALVMAGSIPFLGERFSRRKLIALIVSLAGCLVVLWGPLGYINFRGVLFALLVAVAYSVYIIGSRKILADIPPVKISAYMAVCCLVFFTVYGAATGSLRINFSITNITTGIVLAVWSTIIGFIAFLNGLKIVGAQNASIISTFEPLYTLILAWILIKEMITTQQIIGGILIMSGVLILNLPVKIIKDKTSAGID